MPDDEDYIQSILDSLTDHIEAKKAGNNTVLQLSNSTAYASTIAASNIVYSTQGLSAVEMAGAALDWFRSLPLDEALGILDIEIHPFCIAEGCLCLDEEGGP